MAKESISKVPSGSVYGLEQLKTWESPSVGGDSGRKRNMAKDAMGDQAAGIPGTQKTGIGEPTGYGESGKK